MTIAEMVESAPALAMPPRPARPLSTLQMMRVGFSNTLAACDEELFDELFVERRYVWGRLFVVSDPDGIKRVLQDNVDNYPRIDPIRRVFAFGSGSGMLCAEGEVWRRHRRILNSTLDRRAVVADVPGLVALAEELARRLDELPGGEALNIGEMFTHFQTRATGQVFAGDNRAIDPMVLRMGHYPGEYGLFDFLTMPRWLRFIDRFRKSRREAKVLHPLLARILAERRAPGYRGRRIPRKSVVAVIPWVVHRHRKLWDDPDRFDPERFTPEAVAARSRYAYLPFSVGPHVCIGATLAMSEILITFAVLARRFRFRLVPDQRIEPIAWTSLRPGRGIHMRVEKRSRSGAARENSADAAAAAG